MIWRRVAAGPSATQPTPAVRSGRRPWYRDERDRARFQKSQSYMVLLDDKVACKNLRCRKRFEITGVQSVAFLQ